jgi:hypothetical protein
MFKRQRVVLKRRVTVGNGRMPRILRIREKTKVGEFEITDHVRALEKTWHVGPLADMCVDVCDAEKYRHEGNR